MTWLLKFEEALQAGRHDPQQVQTLAAFIAQCMRGASADSRVLDRVIEHHQSHLKLLGVLAELLPDEIQQTREISFLLAVAYYDEQHQRPQGDRDWLGAYERFGEIGTAEGYLRFYIPNYKLLCARNAGELHWRDVATQFTLADVGARSIGNQLQHQLLGFLYLNYGRHCIDNLGQYRDGIKWLKAACEHRGHWYQYASSCGTMSDPDKKNARTQLVKMAESWDAFMKNVPADQRVPCPVTPDIIRSVMADGPIDPQFFVKT